MNLLIDPWIPVRTASGKQRVIAPNEITSNSDDPFVDFDAPRTDFNGGLILFMAGLVDTIIPPANERAWRRLDENPPSSDELSAVFEPFRHAFHLDEGELRFMQTPKAKPAEVAPPDQLLLGAASANARRNNKDVFAKRTSAPLCSACGAMALHTYMLSGYSRGGGFVAGLRGAGRVATVHWRKSLWHSIWSNVAVSAASEGPTFPWLHPSLGSDETSGKKTQTNIVMADVAPAAHHWPPRTWVWCEWNEDSAACQVCGTSSPGRRMTGVRIKQKGNKFVPPWRHPFSPTETRNAGKPNEYVDTLKTPSSHVGFSDWVALTVGNSSQGQLPAPILASSRSQTVRVFGHAFDQATVNGCIDVQVPLLAPARREALQWVLNDFVSAAAQAVDYVLGYLKSALYRGKPHGYWGSSFVASVRSRLWAELEVPFFRFALDEASEDTEEARESWLKCLGKFTPMAFDAAADTAEWNHPDLARLFQARAQLVTALKGKKLRTAVGLATPTRSVKARKETDEQ